MHILRRRDWILQHAHSAETQSPDSQIRRRTRRCVPLCRYHEPRSLSTTHTVLAARAYEVRHRMEAFMARFSPYLMADDDFKALATLAAEKGVRPRDLHASLVDQKWLLTAAQANELVQA